MNYSETLVMSAWGGRALKVFSTLKHQNPFFIYFSAHEQERLDIIHKWYLKVLCVQMHGWLFYEYAFYNSWFSKNIVAEVAKNPQLIQSDLNYIAKSIEKPAFRCT